MNESLAACRSWSIGAGGTLPGGGQPVGDLVGAADGFGGRGERLRRQRPCPPAAGLMLLLYTVPTTEDRIGDAEHRADLPDGVLHRRPGARALRRGGQRHPGRRRRDHVAHPEAEHEPDHEQDQTGVVRVTTREAGTCPRTRGRARPGSRAGRRTGRPSSRCAARRAAGRPRTAGPAARPAAATSRARSGSRTPGRAACPAARRTPATTPTSGTENDRIRNSDRSSDGWSLRDSQQHEADQDQHAERRSQRAGRSSRPSRRRLLDAVDERDQADDRQHEAERVERPGCGFLRLRDQSARSPTIADGDDRHVDEEDRAPAFLTSNIRCSSRSPPSIGPSATAPPTAAAQMPIALPRSCGGKITVMIDSVTGSTDAPPTPISAAEARSAASGSAANAHSSEAAPNSTQADDQDALAAEPVAQDAPGEQQRREDAASRR